LKQLFSCIKNKKNKNNKNAKSLSRKCVPPKYCDLSKYVDKNNLDEYNNGNIEKTADKE